MSKTAKLLQRLTVRSVAWATMLVLGVLVLGGTPAFAAEKGTIGVSMPTIQGPWYTALLYGGTDEAKKLGYKTVILDAGGYAHVDKQVTHISNLIVQKVKAILMDPANPAAFNGVVRQAQKAGIPVIGSGSPVVASDVAPDAAASSSHCNLGKELAKGARILLPNGGTIAALSGPPGAFWSGDRWRCFKETIKGTNIKVIAEKNSAGVSKYSVKFASPTNSPARFSKLFDNKVYSGSRTKTARNRPIPTMQPRMAQSSRLIFALVRGAAGPAAAVASLIGQSPG